MNKDIGKKIREMRRSRLMSQSGLAAKSGIAVSTLSYIENGKKLPQFGTLSAICRGLDITVLELLSSESKKNDLKIFEQSMSAKQQAPAKNMPDGDIRELEMYVFKNLISEATE